MYIHKENQPSPVLVVQRKRCTSLDEEGNEDLYSFDDPLNSGVSQLAAPYFKVAILARVAFYQLSGWLKVFRRSVFLDMCVEIGCLVKGLCKRMTQYFPTLQVLSYSPARVHSLRVSSMSVALVSPTALNFLS